MWTGLAGDAGYFFAGCSMSMETISDDDCLFDVDRAAWDRIIEKRGGCRCCISPPCYACTEPITEDELNSVGYTYEAPAARFPEVSCSQCGQGFGPGDSGFSHCDEHEVQRPTAIGQKDGA